MNSDSTRHSISIILCLGLVATVILLAILAPDAKLTYMFAGGFLSAVSGAIGYYFRDVGRRR